MDEQLLLVYCTFPDWENASRIGRLLVEENLVACVNLVPGIQSIYRWEGALEQSQEVLALMKTSRYPALENRIKELHPYQVPEIIAVSLAAGLPAYLEWALKACTEPKG